MIKKLLLARDQLMPKMHLSEPGFMYSTYRPFTKNKQRTQKFKEIGDQNELYKTCFQYDMAYGAYKDLPRRTSSDKVLLDKKFAIASDPKYDEYQCGLISIVNKYNLEILLPTKEQEYFLRMKNWSVIQARHQKIRNSKFI